MYFKAKKFALRFVPPDFYFVVIDRIIVSVFKFKLTEMVGRQEFDIPKQVLDIVYNQTLCW